MEVRLQARDVVGDHVQVVREAAAPVGPLDRREELVLRERLAARGPELRARGERASKRRERDQRRGASVCLTCAMMPGIELNFSVTISCIFAASAEPSTNSGNLKKTATARASVGRVTLG